MAEISSTEGEVPITSVDFANSRNFSPSDIIDNTVRQTLVPIRRTYQRYAVILIEYLLSITRREPIVDSPIMPYPSKRGSQVSEIARVNGLVLVLTIRLPF